MHPAFSIWSDAWRGLGVAEPAGLLDSLIARYDEPHRAYHNLRHIEDCLDSLEPASHLAERPFEMQLALWFHDAIYDPSAEDNEVASADFARASVLLAGAGEANADRIGNMVLATRHDVPAKRTDAQLVADADLAILAAPRERFEEYQRRIRREHEFMPAGEFQRQRRQILEQFLSRPAIYQSDWFSTRLEQAARANIANELTGIHDGDTR